MVALSVYGRSRPVAQAGQKITPSAAPVHSSAVPVPTARRQEPAPLH